ncbi:hypothetical protein EV182_000061 [Spiromyces aspiralis]|uniref:Uncharacterized protein n=1 Tax=Spiromyces aspiralis TaxID=68401 RepID=A0ACC1HVN8_9FUNG|nr:hypothetical protein EV182_000061 [Spiromyces aspiralis]
MTSSVAPIIWAVRVADRPIDQATPESRNRLAGLDVDFNISHDGDWVIVALTINAGTVGVDVASQGSVSPKELSMDELVAMLRPSVGHR